MAITQKKPDYNAILNAASNQAIKTLPYTPGSGTLQGGTQNQMSSGGTTGGAVGSNSYQTIPGAVIPGYNRIENTGASKTASSQRDLINEDLANNNGRNTKSIQVGEGVAKLIYNEPKNTTAYWQMDPRDIPRVGNPNASGLTTGGMTNEQAQAAYYAALNGGMSGVDIGAAMQDMAIAQPVNPNTLKIGGTNYDAGMFTGDGYYWKGDKMYSTATGKEATQADYDAVNRISMAEGVDKGVAAAMYRANQAYDTNSYGDGAWKAETETALQNALANGTSGDFVRLPNESLQDMADRVLATRQAETGAQVVNYGAGDNLIGGGTGSGAPAGTMYQQILGSYTGGTTPSDYGTAPEYGGDPYQVQMLDASNYGTAPTYQGDRYAYDQMSAGQYGNAPERQNTYEPEYQRILQEARNTPKFQWDQDTDPVWQALAKQYRREGQRATADTMGAAAGMTGGIPSSYAVTAAAQAGNNYAAQLSDRLPEVYQQAYQRYLDEYSRRLGLADYYAQGMQMEENRYNTDLNQFNQNRNFQYGVDSDNWNRAYELNQTDYQRYLDSLGQFNTDRDFRFNTDMANNELAMNENNTAWNRYQDALAQYQDDRNFRYNVDSDNWERNMANQELQISEQQRQIENAMNIAQTYGYIPNQQVADILGLPVGTKTSDQQYQEWEQSYKDKVLGADLSQDERDFDYQKYLDDYDIGRQMENDQYSRRQQEQADAQQRIAAFLSIGGDVSQLDPDLIEQSGYSKAELNQMQRYYAQPGVGSSGGGSSGGGSSGGGSSGGGTTGRGMTDGAENPAAPDDSEKLMEFFPNGYVNNARDWNTLLKMYGEDWLRQKGFRFVEPRSNDRVNIPVSESGPANSSGIDAAPKPGISYNYFNDNYSQSDENFEAEYQAALGDTDRAVSFLSKYGQAPLSESEFSRSTAMTNQYKTYSAYVQAMLAELMR